jgi:hypothetical protein
MTIELMALGGISVLLVIRNTKKRRHFPRRLKGVGIVLMIIDAVLFFGGLSLFIYGAISLFQN